MMSQLEFQEFNPDYEPSSTGTRWKGYKERFENFMIAKHGKEMKDIADAIKKASLLHFAGEKVLNMYNTKKKTEDKFEDVVRILDEFFVEQVNPEYEKYIFSKAVQAKGETFDAYVTRLKLLANNCGFTDKDAEIKSRIIQGFFSDSLRQKALTNKDWELKNLIDEGRAMEISRRQASLIEEKTNSIAMISSSGQKHEKHKNKTNFGENVKQMWLLWEKTRQRKKLLSS